MNVNIIDYGARTQDILVTEQIQTAIDDVFKAGGGTVEIPAGIYRVGGLRLRSRVTLHLQSGAMLEGSENPEDYTGWLKDTLEPIADYDEELFTTKKKRSAVPFSRWNNALIRAYDAEDVAVIGEPYSYINGCNVYDPTGEEDYRGPHGINMQRCKNVTLKGYTLRNTGNWAHDLTRCENIEIANVTVYGGHDGIDLMLCERVRIRNCRLDTGDDGIAGFGSKDVIISDTILNSSCSAARFGGTDVLFERCKTEPNPPFGFRGSLSPEDRARSISTNEAHRHSTKTSFLYYCDERFGALPYVPGNIVFKDCDFDGVRHFVVIPYGSHIWCRNEPLRSLTFEGCRFANLAREGYLYGDPVKTTELTLKNCTLEAIPGSEQSVILEAHNFTRLTLENIKTVGYTNPTVVHSSDAPIVLSGSEGIALRKIDCPEQSKPGF